MATIKDVALAAAVQPATVSYVLNRSGSVSEATRQRVLAAVEALQYQPSHSARALKRRQSDTLGVVVAADRAEPVAWGTVVTGLVSTAAEQGFEVLIRPTMGQAGTQRALRELVSAGRTDGVVLLDLAGQPEAEQCVATSLPTVRSWPAAADANVWIDQSSGVLEAIGHLIVNGRLRIGFITPPLEWGLTEQQERGYRLALQEAGFQFDPALVVTAGTAEQAGFMAMEELLQQDERLDAVFIGLAGQTWGAIHALQDAGLVVGEAIAVVAGDEPAGAAHAAPPLTALRQPWFALGRALAEAVIAQVRGEEARSHVLVPQLMVRRSCGASA
ncbi:MAG: LacI family DNA-binding transcriptional regulator [Herpetosiphon sp.]